MTNLTRLRLILVDLSGFMKKNTYLKQNVLFVKKKNLHKQTSYANEIKFHSLTFKHSMFPANVVVQLSLQLFCVWRKQFEVSKRKSDHSV